MTLLQLIAELGDQTEDGRTIWQAVNSSTFTRTASTGTVTVSGSYVPSVGFTGSVVLTNTAETELARLDVEPGGEFTSRVQRLYNAARKASVDVNALIDQLVAELDI